MKLTFIGADHEVTGSCHFIQVGNKNIVLDYGMEQGRDMLVNQKIPVAESEIDYVFLSHAHIDHSGMIPFLYKNGFRGKVYATEATVDLCRVMLRDSAHIQEFEAQWRNRKAKRAGEPLFEPIYTMEDAEGVLSCFVECRYDDIVEVDRGIKIRFVDVGHLLGSASIEVWLTENNVTKKLVYSGDIGNIHQPIIEDPSTVDDADYVIMESTYGNRFHGETPDYVGEFSKVIQETFDRGGNVVIPAFAVGRTQEMLYFIRQIKEEKRIRNHKGFKVYVDSPLAIEAIKIFNENVYNCFDDEALELVKQGIDPISFPGLKIAISPDESQAINFDPDPKVIISASGMCEAGRIRHHLKHNLWKSENTILFVGYQAIGSLGRILLDGADTIKLFNETIEVKAEIKKIDGVSGHADKNGLINWINGFKERPKRVFVVHGEESVADEFSECLSNEHGYSTYCPYSGAEFDLVSNRVIKDGLRIPVEQRKTSEGRERANRLIISLNSAKRRLDALVEASKKGTNSQMEELIRQINDLCDKFQ